jgi:hypothetical protein
MRMRSSLVIRASDCQCQFGPGFRSQHPSAQWNRGAADEAVLKTVRKKLKIRPKNIN